MSVHKKKKNLWTAALSLQAPASQHYVLPVHSGMADSQSKRVAAEVEVFVGHLEKRRETDIYLEKLGL